MDKQSFTSHVKAAERSLYRIARSYLSTDADAADAVQEALMRAWAKRHTLRMPEYFGTWLTRILINVCKSSLRGRGRVTPMAQVPEPWIAPDAGEDALGLRIALSAMDVLYRVPLVLYYLDGFSVKQISDVLNIPQGTAKNRLFRARQQLKSYLQEEVFEDEEA